MDYNYQIRLRRGTSTQWELSDPVLLDGEPGYDTTLNYYKIGDGVRRWSELPWTTGLKGDPATVDAGSTTTVDYDSMARVENVGTTQNAIFDFEIPEGKPGKDLFIHEGSAQNPPVDWLPRELLWDPDAEPTVGDIPFGNLLTPNQASGTDALGTTEGFDRATLYNATVRSLVFAGALEGSRVVASTQKQYQDGYIVLTNPVPIKSGVPYTFTVSTYWNAPSGDAAPTWMFYDSSGLHIGAPPYRFGQVHQLPSQEWRAVGHTLRPSDIPPQATHIAVGVSLPIRRPEGTEVYFDRLGLWEGAGGDWAMPGTPILNQGRRVSRPNGTDRLVEVWDGAAWCVVHYDSGWRDVTGMLTAPWTGGGYPLRLRRIGGSVYLNAWATTGTATDATAITVPVGFRPGQTVAYLIAWGSDAHNVVVNTNGTVAPAAPVSALRWALQWPADDAIPTSLPGTLVSTAP